MRLKWFVFGIVATLIVLSAAAYVYLEQGFVDARADVQPGMLDRWLGASMDASTKRHAPNPPNPVADTRENLLAAATLYGEKCGICHGGPDGKASEVGEALNPPAPQFFGSEPPDMMPNENFYIIQHGVRMTGMPAWSKLLSDEQIGQVVLLLKHINDKNVPAEVEQELNRSAPRSTR